MSQDEKQGYADSSGYARPRRSDTSDTSADSTGSIRRTLSQLSPAGAIESEDGPVKVSAAGLSAFRRTRSRSRPAADTQITYKNPESLEKFLTERGKIMPRRLSGLSPKQQRKLMREVKRARHLALLPFISD